MNANCEPCGSCSISGKKAMVDKLQDDLNSHLAAGDYRSAYPVSIRILDEARDLYGAGSADYAVLLNDAASIERAIGLYEDAERHFSAAGRALRETLGERDPEYATTLNNLAGLHRLMGKHEEAEAEFKRALEIYRSALGEGDWHTISCYNNIGLLWQDMGRCEEARGCHVSALELLQASDAPEAQASIATTLMNGAVCSTKLGDLDEAVALYDYAMELIIQVHGKEGAAYAGALNNVAAHHVEIGEFERACELLTESRALTERLFGTDSTTYELVCENLAYAQARSQAVDRT